MVTVKTSDGQSVRISSKLQQASDFMRDDDDDDERGSQSDPRPTRQADDDDDDELLLPHVTARQLELAQAFVDLVSDEDEPPHVPAPLPLDDLQDIFGPVLADFVRQIDMNEVLQLVVAADFLGMNDLLGLLSAHVALAAAHGQVDLAKLPPQLL